MKQSEYDIIKYLEKLIDKFGQIWGHHTYFFYFLVFFPVFLVKVSVQ